MHPKQGREGETGADNHKEPSESRGGAGEVSVSKSSSVSGFRECRDEGRTARSQAERDLTEETQAGLAVCVKRKQGEKR